MINYTLMSTIVAVALVLSVILFVYFLVKDKGGLRIYDRLRLLRDTESSYLPYFLYDEKNNVFYNDDGSINYIWECVPSYFSSQSLVDGLNIIFEKKLLQDKKYSFQIINIADTDTSSFFERYKGVRVNPNPITEENTRHTIEFFEQTEQAQKKLGMRVKNFKLYIVLKLEDETDPELINDFEASLVSTDMHPRRLGVNETLSVIRKSLGVSEKENHKYDNTQLIKDQLLPVSSSLYVDKKKGLMIRRNELEQDTYISSLSLISTTGINDRLDSIELNTLLGGYLKDTESINCKIVVTMTILDSHDLVRNIEGKASHFYKQKQTKTSNFKTGSKRETYDHFFINSGKDNVLTFYYTIAVHSLSESANKTTRNNLISLFNRQGFTLDLETILTQVMYYNTLPFRFIYDNAILSGLARHLVAPSKAIAGLSPHQSDYKGNYYPALALAGRKGQMVGFNLYGKNIVNHNFLCTGGTGKGKSVLMNMVLESLIATNVKVRIVDLGDSYKRLCGLFDGKYIDISDEGICLNPFPFDIEKLDDREKALRLVATSNVISEMAYASTDNRDVDAIETQIILEAVKSTYESGAILKGIDTVISYCLEESNFSDESLFQKAKQIAFLLKEFSTIGIYGTLFNGIPSLNYTDESLVILETESLKANPVLFKIVTFQVLNQMTQNIYQGERGDKEAIIFEEAANMFMESIMLEKIIEEAYRRIRKYGGSLGIVTQSILDTEDFGAVGRVIVENSGTKLLLDSPAYEKAIKQNILSYSGLAKELLLDVSTKIPFYSEVFIDQEDIVGIARLPLSNYQYGMTTSKDSEVKVINDLIEKNDGDIATSLKEFANEMAG